MELRPYEGNDMAGFIMEYGVAGILSMHGPIKSITNVRDTAIIITEFAVLRATPCNRIGFQIETLIRL